MGKQTRGWARVSDSALLLIAGAVVGCIISFAATPSLQRLFENIEQQLGPFVFTVSTLSSCAIVYAILRAIRYRIRSKSTRQTAVHYLKVLKSINPLGPIVFSLQLVFLVSLFFLGVRLDIPVQQLKKPICLVFFCLALPLGLLGWIAVGTWYRYWLLKRTKTVVDVLAEKQSGLLHVSTLNNKDQDICDTLYSLEKCHFIFVWAINFSGIIGHEKSDALDQIAKLFKNNQEMKFFLLLQCPFCEGVIERAIELDVSYGPEYITACVESSSNCQAFRVEYNYPVQIALAHREPFIRSILWGHFIEKSAIDNPLDLAEDPLFKEDSRDPCLRYMSSVEWGGFTLQQYIPAVDGCYSPLYKGSTLTHGGLWNRIRYKFAIEFSKGINPDESLKPADKVDKADEVDKTTLEHLARDFGMSKRKAKKSSEVELLAFINDKTEYGNFIQRIQDRANTKANVLRGEAGC